MRKQSVIHLHRLAVEVCGHLAATTDLPVEPSAVDDPTVAEPLAIHRGKAAHEAGLRRTLAEIVEALESDAVPAADTPGEPPRPPR